jgi:hypothetical protein
MRFSLAYGVILDLDIVLKKRAFAELFQLKPNNTRLNP